MSQDIRYDVYDFTALQDRADDRTASARFFAADKPPVLPSRDG
jgi:hypothetical protein